ncbi:hypothetical protein QA648_06095 [Rhizobium sp. CB3171]|uniref:hypothetical protein n=1 Tax=Rhizobium sp. CB3171 TaxID=3039157 RepID=UPI0024B269DD|nr:hypothetical protein [Rhizobium sp. CB3171]WFU03323.1 hypothetical protein QA648_06095 [Rhizobium sp. CB3171]
MNAVTVPVAGQIAAPNGEIPAGTTMQLNQWAISPNNLYVLIMQTDGNLVLYQVDGAPPKPNSTFQGYAIWSSNTDDDIPFVFAIQTDGNLVIYNESVNPRQVMWSPNTQSSSPAYLAVQADANLVYYDTSKGVIWTSNTQVYMPPMVPTLANGATGRFDWRDVAWHSLNNEGDNGSIPTVSLSSDTLTFSGGFQWEAPVIGSGTGDIYIQISLTPVTCSVTIKMTGYPLDGNNMSQSGTWQLTPGDEPVLTCNLDNGGTLIISTFDGGGIWWPGVEIEYMYGFDLCFENMSGASASVIATQQTRESPLRHAV